MVKPSHPSPPDNHEDVGVPHERKSSVFSAFDSLSDGISVFDKDMTIVFMNKKLLSKIGDFRGRKCYESPLGTPEICSRCPGRKGEWEVGSGPFVERGVDEHGYNWESSVTRYVDPETNEAYYVNVERDITERSAMEAELKMLMSSLDQMADPVCVTDTEGRVVYVNKAYVGLTGYDEKSVAGLSITESSKPGAPSGTMQTIMKAAVEVAWRGEMTGLRKDGTRYYTQVDAKPVTGGNGRSIGAVGILRDITRQKTELVEYEKYTSELESRMEARTTELARKVSQLTTINKISRVVTSILDLDELIHEFTKSIAQGFGYRHVSMMMMDKERGDLYFKSGYGWQMDSVPKDMRQKLKEGIIGHAAYFGETLVSGDVESDPRYVRKDLVGTKSELAVPVTYRGEILGVLDIQSDVKDTFTRNDVSTMEMLADMLASSITNARVYTESKERETALSILDRISKQISYRLEPNVILDQAARDAVSLLKAEKAMVGLVDESGKTLRFVASYRFDKEVVKSRAYKANVGVSGRALRSLKTEVVNDYLSDPDAVEIDAETFSIKSIVCAPLMIEGRGIGVVNVYNKLAGKPFTKSDTLFLSSLADHAAIALENANLLSSLNQRVHSQLALLETALSMQRQLDTSSVYELVADKLKNVVWYDGITFYRVDNDRMIISPILSKGKYAKEIMAEEFAVGVGLTGYVANTGKAELVNDALNDPRVAQVAGTPVEDEALMSIPLLGKNRVIGVLTLYREGLSDFSPTEYEVAQLFASQAAVAVENAELYGTRETLLADSRRKVEQMAKVLELTTSVMYMDDLDRLLQRITDSIVQSLGFRRVEIGVWNPARDLFVVKAMSGYPKWVEKESTMEGQSVLDDLNDKFKIGASSYLVKFEDQRFGIEHFQFLAHPELADAPRASPDAWHERDILRTALKDRSGRLTGYLLVDEPNDLKIPSADHIEVLEIMAGIASIALENAKVYDKQVLAANEIALLNDLMTHDINNFNQGIMGYLELLLEDKRLDDNQRKYADRALIQVKNNARLIDNIRKLAKLRMMADTDFVPMDIQKSIAGAIDIVTKSAPDKKITIISPLSPNTHFTTANQYLDDLFLNIISNAVKFDSSKRIRVEIQISEEVTPQGEYWIISVIDRGRGIPDDRKDAVFERFATGMTGIKGFGLGLSIVSTIVEKFNGRIWVEDRIKGDFSKGTVFRVGLPKADKPSEDDT
jgi:PAS domain S-box-containing protein